MNQRRIGVIVIIAACLLAALIYVYKQKEELAILFHIQKEGTCFLADGTCLHATSTTLSLLGWILAAALFMLGVYLLFFDKTQRLLVEQHERITSTLEHVKKTEHREKAFEAFLAAFNDDEKAVLRAIKEQDGITQSTLRYKTGMSKTGLSLLLKSLGERSIITRKTEGKTNQVFLRKRF